MGSETFRYQKELSQYYQLIYVDLVDSGRSTKRVEETSVSRQAEMVHALIQKLKLPPVVVCGYSNGGSIAQEFALRFPEKTRGVILIGGFPEVSTFLLGREFDLGIWAAKNEWLPLFSYVLPAAHFRSKQHQKEMAHFIKQADAKTLQTIYTEGKQYVSTDRLNQLSVPVLLIYGENDIVARPYIKMFYQQVQDLQVVLVSGVAHQVPTKRPAQCNEIIKGWMTRKQLDH